ncbi:MAG: hypothetical protein ACM3MI_11100, partial [Clostridiales bacterium]
MQRFTSISFRLTTLMLLLILASTENLSAQTTGIIRGSVKQSDGTAVPYATVTLLNTPLGAASDAQG